MDETLWNSWERPLLIVVWLKLQDSYWKDFVVRLFFSQLLFPRSRMNFSSISWLLLQPGFYFAQQSVWLYRCWKNIPHSWRDLKISSVLIPTIWASVNVKQQQLIKLHLHAELTHSDVTICLLQETDIFLSWHLGRRKASGGPCTQRNSPFTEKHALGSCHGWRGNVRDFSFSFGNSL